jgi:pimeloyl-ACP methyl ester carboxylesterase
MSYTADVNGLQLFYRDHGSGTPLLLLHGFAGTGDDWRHVFAGPLNGYRVITPDLRGHGRPTNPSSSDSPMSHEMSSHCSIALASPA